MTFPFSLQEEEGIDTLEPRPIILILHLGLSFCKLITFGLECIGKLLALACSLSLFFIPFFARTYVVVD
ncbi:hypothetical protein J3F84DRAFT_61038 [Trichoderma pleuroticola]